MIGHQSRITSDLQDTLTRGNQKLKTTFKLHNNPERKKNGVEINNDTTGNNTMCLVSLYSVGHLAGELVHSLKSQGENISSIDMFCVQIAGLCHDLGE